MKDASAEAIFDLINKEIDRLIKRLDAKGVCACCVANGMLHRGALLSRDVVGSEETRVTCEEIIDLLCERNVPAPAGAVQH